MIKGDKETKEAKQSKTDVREIGKMKSNFLGT